MWAVVAGPLIATTALVAFILGFLGFQAYFSNQGVPKSTTDLAYLSLQLFVLESGSLVQVGAPWQFEVARLLAPLATATALVATAMVVFRREIEAIRLRSTRRHVVICGLGTRGLYLAKTLSDDGHRVVAIDLDPAATGAAELHDRRILTVTGDGRDVDVLRRAGVGRASRLVALAGSDDINADVAVLSRHLADERHGEPLTCLVHLQDADLAVLMRSQELARGGHDSFRLEFFNIYEEGARVLLRDHPILQIEAAEAPHLLVWGLNPLAESLLVGAARSLADAHAAGPAAVVTAIGPDVVPHIAALGRRYPSLRDNLEIRTIAADDFDCCLLDGSGSPPMTVAYIFDEHDAGALEIALRARNCQQLDTVPVIVQMNRPAGLSELLNELPPGGRLHAFNLFERTLSAELLLGGTYELLARAIHERYRAKQLQQEPPPEDSPSLAPWGALPESLRESNRHQAADIGVKLTAIHCGIAPLSDWTADGIRFSEREIELMAELEHERWVRERLRQGWKPGLKDVEAKTSPYLLPWGEIGDDVRELDRDAVRAIPDLLRGAGFQVVRAGGGEPSDPPGLGYV